MLINTKPFGASHVRFVSYTGRHPCRCHGNLVLNINGEDVEFGFRNRFGNVETGSLFPGNDPDNFEANHKNVIFERFWNPTDGEWEVDFAKLPVMYLEYAEEIDRVFCEHIEHGHCGGCA
jgi:hypothetical protein